ncbi:MAG: L,D-transpeptidase [Bdellovibrionota bacterium]
MKAILFGLLVTLTLASAPAFTQESNSAPVLTNAAQADTDGFDELDPFDPNVESTLQMMDWLYEFQTGESSQIDANQGLYYRECYRQTCAVWIQVYKPTQTAYLYINGNLQYTWAVSTGTPDRETPRFDRHPNGRIYDRYTSSKFPGGDWNGLGNMPYAVFIDGGFAIHGTGTGNWKRLGRKASHGCIRLHPDNAIIFNRLVRQQGIYNVWITVE